VSGDPSISLYTVLPLLTLRTLYTAGSACSPRIDAQVLQNCCMDGLLWGSRCSSCRSASWKSRSCPLTCVEAIKLGIPSALPCPKPQISSISHEKQAHKHPISKQVQATCCSRIQHDKTFLAQLAWESASTMVREWQA
jgi:hypothetical protein